MTSPVCGWPPPAELPAALLTIEASLDPANPALPGSGVEILGYGEVSAVLGLTAFPNLVFKRMSGFRGAEAVSAYVAVVERYVATLETLGVQVAPTHLVSLQPARGRHVVYLVQPRLAGERFGNALLQRGDMHEVYALLDRVLSAVCRVVEANRPRGEPPVEGERRVGIDAQLSNWHWPVACVGREPVLIDIGTPFVLLAGEVEVGVDVFLSAYPAPVRWWLRRARSVERYLDDYFDFRSVVVDLLGNFIKEGAGARLESAVDWVNAWIAARPGGARLGRVDTDTVRRYYARDAATLELALRLRRMNRFLATRVLGRRYDFVLPGTIRR